MNRNVFETLGVAGKEDPVSNLLTEMINDDINFANSFLKCIDGSTGNYDELNARTRLRTEHGNPDIVLKAIKNGYTDLYVIENKLKAKEGKNQTEKYTNKEVIENIQDKLEIESLNNTEYLFLTLFPDLNPSSNQFKKTTYKEMIKNTEYTGNDQTLEKLYHDLKNIVIDFYSYAEMEENDIITKKLSPEEGSLEKNYLYFRILFQNLDYPGELEHQTTFRESKSGRRYFGTKISKDRWKPSKIQIKNGEIQKFNPKKDIDIHIEPQYNIINQKLEIKLHYETNPYKTKKELKKKTSKQKYNQFRKHREKFIKQFKIETKKQEIQNLKINYNYYLQFGKIILYPEGMKLKKFRKKFLKKLEKTEKAIDKAIAET